MAKNTKSKASTKKVTDAENNAAQTASQEQVQATAEPKERKPKEEVSPEIADMERKVLSLCVLGAWPSVKHILKSYKWKDKVCARIAGAVNYCDIHGEYINSNSVQLAVIRLYPETKTDITEVTKKVLAPNFLIPYSNKLISLG